jgi:hypothetical protein
MIIFDQWMNIMGRGWVATCTSDAPHDDIPKLKPGEWIEINEERYKILGVEVTRGSTGLSSRFGILISGPPKENRVIILGKPIPFPDCLDC